jgi:electron transfer flavoprotein alpha subunit
MSQLLIIAEHNGTQLSPNTAKCVSCAVLMEPSEIVVAVLGDQCAAVAEQAAQVTGVSRVVTLDRPENAKPLAAVFAPQLADLSANFDIILAPSSTFGKDLLPQIAAMLGVGQISDIMSVEGPRTFKRPVYAGNAIVTLTVPGSHKIIGTVRVASFRAAETGGTASIESISVDAQLPAHTRYVELKSEAGDRPDLQSANLVLSGGRGVGNAENFKILYQLADKIGAGVGASRAAVDAGFVPNDMQVGQTGKIISPDLYIAFGISGAIQHLTGIKDAGTIVAVNKDPEAPIFEIADIGLVGDLFEVITELDKQLN